MKKYFLVLAAIFVMAQTNAATNETATSETAIAVSADENNDDESVYQHPFKDNDESTKHWSIVTSGFYVGAGVHHNWERINNSFEVGMLNFAAVNYNSLHGQNLSLGVGLHHRSYSMKRPYMLYRAEGSNVVLETTYPSENVNAIKDRSSNLNLWSVQFPLMFTQKIVKKLDLTVAGILNWNTYARVDNHYEMSKVEYDTKYKDLKQNKINFDFMGALTWNQIGIYCRYTPGKFFKEGYGPEIKETWTLGLTLGL